MCLIWCEHFYFQVKVFRKDCCVGSIQYVRTHGNQYNKTTLIFATSTTKSNNNKNKDDDEETTTRVSKDNIVAAGSQLVFGFVISSASNEPELFSTKGYFCVLCDCHTFLWHVGASDYTPLGTLQKYLQFMHKSKHTLEGSFRLFSQYIMVALENGRFRNFTIVSISK